VCSQKVYLMERHLENNQLYHRQCIRDQQKAESARYRRSVDELALRETLSVERGESLTEESEENDSMLGLGNQSQASSATNLVKSLYSVPAYHSVQTEIGMETGTSAVEVKPLAKQIEVNQAGNHALDTSTTAMPSERIEVVLHQKVNCQEFQSRHTYTSRTLLTGGNTACEIDINQSRTATTEASAIGGDSLRTSVLHSLAAVRARSTSNSGFASDHIPVAAVSSQSYGVLLMPQSVSDERMSKVNPAFVPVSGARQSTVEVSNISDIRSASDQLSTATGSTLTSPVHSTSYSEIRPVYLNDSTSGLARTGSATSSEVIESKLLPLPAAVRSVVTVAQVSQPKATTLPRQNSSGSSGTIQPIVLGKTVASPAVVSSSGITNEIELDSRPIVTVGSDQALSNANAGHFTAMKKNSSDQLPFPKSLTSVLPSTVSKPLPTLLVDLTQITGTNSPSIESNASCTNKLPSAPSPMVTSSPTIVLTQHITHPVIAPAHLVPLPTSTVGKNCIEAKSDTLRPNTESSAIALAVVQKYDTVPRRPAPVAPAVNLSATVTSAKNSELVSKPVKFAPGRPAPIAATCNILNKPTSSTVIPSCDLQISTAKQLVISKDLTITSSVSGPAKDHYISTAAANSSVLSSSIDVILPPVLVRSVPDSEEMSSHSKNSVKSCKPIPVTRRFISAKLPDQPLPVSGCNDTPMGLPPSPVLVDLSIGCADVQSGSSSTEKQRPVAKPRRLDLPAPANSSETCTVSTSASVVSQKLCSFSTTSANITNTTSQESMSMSHPRRSLSLVDRQTTFSVWTSQKAVPSISTGVKQPISAPLRPPPTSANPVPGDSLPLKYSDTSKSLTVADKSYDNSEFSTSIGSKIKVSDTQGTVVKQTSPTPPVRMKKAAKLIGQDLSSPPTRPLPPAAMNGEKTRQKITPDVTFTFEKDAFRSGPVRSAPLRPAPPPPAGGAVIKRQVCRSLFFIHKLHLLLVVISYYRMNILIICSVR